MNERLSASLDCVEHGIIARCAQGAKAAERLIFLNRRKRRQFKKALRPAGI
jgi:hypothetical protein